MATLRAVVEIEPRGKSGSSSSGSGSGGGKSAGSFSYWGAMFAGVCVVPAPMIALFSRLGSRIIQGMTVGIGK